ncbi:hypothetical protein [Formosa sp. PL04]|uniref:hypothetical protein n=1 Tax=Formosa sp. PL04 TaxID=3081755 RepID=UPI002980ED40|nr:hypothetical protein [Formosa sp. PL04]MDW5291002.1 hypothetical protein [Formosa sp. PL04]
MKKYSVIIICLCLWTCNSTDKEVKEVVVVEEISPFVFKDDISKIEYTDYILDSKAKTDIESWNMFVELQNALTLLKSGDVSYFQGYSKTMETAMKELIEGIPPVINTPAIQARFLTLETKMLKLQNVLSLQNIPKAEQLQNVKETLVAYSNLNLQINKKYEKDAQHIIKP